MTLSEIAYMVASFGYPWRYSHFSQTPALPYVVYYFPNSNDVFADSTNYVDKRALFIELFTKAKDPTAEANIEAVLKSKGLTWYKQTDFLSDELIYQTTYEMEVIINGE